MSVIWAKMGHWALMGRQKTGPGWAKMGQATAQSTAMLGQPTYKNGTFFISELTELCQFSTKITWILRRQLNRFKD